MTSQRSRPSAAPAVWRTSVTRVIVQAACAALLAAVTRGVRARLAGAPASVAGGRAPSRSHAEDDAFLEDLSKRSFMFFWEQADPATASCATGRAPTARRPSEAHDVGSIASVGFGLTGCASPPSVAGCRARLVERARDDACASSRRSVSEPRLVLSLGEHPHRRARVEERGVVDRHGAADGRRAHRPSVFQGRSGDRRG